MKEIGWISADMDVTESAATPQTHAHMAAKRKKNTQPALALAQGQGQDG